VNVTNSPVAAMAVIVEDSVSLNGCELLKSMEQNPGL